MVRRIYNVLIQLLLFWAITDLFSGIVIREGFMGYVICGGIFGLVMLIVVPMIKFFTLPVKFISIFLISIMLSVIVFFFLNFAVPFIDFTDGEIVGLSNRYFELPTFFLGMIGNVSVGGVVAGILSACLKWLEIKSRNE